MLPRGLRRGYEEAAADPHLLSLRHELATLEALREDALRRMCKAPPPWKQVAAAYRRLVKAAESGDQEALRAALEELGALTGKGAGAAEAYEEAEGELRALIQEIAKLALAEARLLRDTGRVLTAEQSVALVAGLAQAVRRWCYDEATWNKGPQAVLQAIHRELAPLLDPRRAATDEAAALEEDTIEGEPP